MTQETPALNNPPFSLFSRFSLYKQKLAAGLETIGEGFISSIVMACIKIPIILSIPAMCSIFAAVLCDVFNIEVQVHGVIPREPALWVSNHISWLDVAVLFRCLHFLSGESRDRKMAILGNLAKGGGTLFIKRGSGG